MRIEATRQVDPAVWDSLVRQLGGSIFHTSVWASYTTARQPNAKPLFMRFVGQDGVPMGVALAFTESSRHRLLAPLTAALWTDAFPVIGDDREGTARELVRTIDDYARRGRFAVVTIGCSGGTPYESAVRNLRFAETRYWEFVLDLSNPEAELWSRMDHERGRKIRKAERSRVVLQESSHEEGVTVLRRMQRESSQRIVARGGPQIGRIDGQSRDPVMELLRSGVGRLVLAKIDGEVVSAALFTYWNSVVYTMLSGHSNLALRTQAPTLLYWETIRRYKSEGATRFSLGGCSADSERQGHPENGVYIYKKGFGGERVECVNYTKTLRPFSRTTVALLKKIWRGAIRSNRQAASHDHS